MRHLHLIIQPPQGLHPESLEALPGLGKLLRRGRPLPPSASVSEASCRALDIARQQDWPIAPLTAQAVGLAVGNDYWLRLDPVHLDVGMQGLYLRAGQVLDEAEASSLHAVLVPLIAQHGLEAFAGAEGVLYVRCENPPRLETTPLDQVDGCQPTRFLPRGEDAPFWTHLLHEVQMALHEHPLNVARMAAGKAPINSLWPWGGGHLVLPARTVDAAWGGAPLLHQLAMALDIPCHPCPAKLAPTLARGETGGLVLLGGDGWETDSPEATIHAWDNAWFQPLAAALRLGRLSTVNLSIPGAAAASRTLGPWDIWRLWA